MELSQSANLPVTSPQERLSSIDLIRGFALLGIGIENLFAVHTHNATFSHYAAQYSQGMNLWLLIGLMVLIRSKFYPIFSFVFGVAAALSLPKQGRFYFFRRSLILMTLGILQVLFIWNGDVLTQYALMSLLLLLVKPLPNLILYVLAAGLLLFSFLGNGLVSVEDMTANEFTQRITGVYSSGAFWQVTHVRWREFTHGFFSWPALLFMCRIFSFLLLGFAFARGGGVKKLQENLWVQKSCLGLVVTAGTIAIWFHLAGWRGESLVSTDLETAKQLLFTLYFFALVGFYLLLPLLLSQWSFLQRALVSLGQYTLTHYLAQNMIFSLLFYHYGLGFYGKLAPWQAVVIYLVLVTAQVWLSIRWKNAGRRGPVEALLRKVAGNG
ncbi:DUF418 domain-containing protein [Sabulibacter ruber]|uniref:DUF418 domain-containing protein n=1 Tax=Sabulibacter ruber TaxID=2811901 RepID=UPI001A9686C8|nr:DUF418 domain-containing protein [Sabulibacter ruber]